MLTSALSETDNNNNFAASEHSDPKNAAKYLLLLSVVCSKVVVGAGISDIVEAKILTDSSCFHSCPNSQCDIKT